MVNVYWWCASVECEWKALLALSVVVQCDNDESIHGASCDSIESKLSLSGQVCTIKDSLITFATKLSNLEKIASYWQLGVLRFVPAYC